MRKQCKKCPWKKGVNPHEIPGEYCETKHEKLKGTIAPQGVLPLPGTPLRVMACHETKPGKELPCVGWLVNQHGVGNNIGLRIAVFQGRSTWTSRLGPQHKRFEDTLPRSTKEKD
jgi:hypothetical protein